MTAPSTPPRFRSAPCEHCSSHVRINDPATQDGERWIRRDERRQIANLVKKQMHPSQFRLLAGCDQPLVVELARILMAAIADRENEDAA